MKFPGLLALGFSGIAVVLGLSPLWLPAPRPSDAPPTEFSAERAWQHVRAIAKSPHPSGTEENQRVRGYLKEEMSRLGLLVRELPGEQGGTRLVNLYGELAGSESGPPAILLVSHYDSVPTGPGAADCASGVATLLETLRALQAGGPVKNSIALLLTDGEELRDTGAQAFIRDHPELWREVRVVLNLEARGNRGPVLMFETSPGPGRLIAELSKRCEFPIGCSWSREVYRRLPNDTDFTEFRKAGCAGMNFAFIGGLEYYHSPWDTPENLSQRTLQHYGSILLPLAAGLAKTDPGNLAQLKNGGEATYFPLWRGCLIRYPQMLGDILVWVTLALFVFALWRQRRLLRVGRVLGSLVVTVLSLCLCVAIGFLGLKLLRWRYHPAGGGVFVVGLPHEEAYLVVMAVVAAGLTVGLNSWLLRRLRTGERLVGALVPWVGLTLLSAWQAPGAAYLFLWPTFFGIVALLFPANNLSAVQTVLRATLVGMPAPLLFAGTLYIINQAVTIGSAPASMGLVALAFSLVCGLGLRAPRPTQSPNCDTPDRCKDTAQASSVSPPPSCERPPLALSQSRE